MTTHQGGHHHGRGHHGVGQKGSVAALDATSELLQTARERLDESPFQDRVSYHEGDIQGLPFEAGRYDLV